MIYNISIVYFKKITALPTAPGLARQKSVSHCLNVEVETIQRKCKCPPAARSVSRSFIQLSCSLVPHAPASSMADKLTAAPAELQRQFLATRLAASRQCIVVLADDTYDQR